MDGICGHATSPLLCSSPCARLGSQDRAGHGGDPKDSWIGLDWQALLYASLRGSAAAQRLCVLEQLPIQALAFPPGFALGFLSTCLLHTLHLFSQRSCGLLLPAECLHWAEQRSQRRDKVNKVSWELGGIGTPLYILSGPAVQNAMH